MWAGVEDGTLPRRKGMSYTKAPWWRPASLVGGPERLQNCSRRVETKHTGPGAPAPPPYCEREQTTPGSHPCLVCFWHTFRASTVSETSGLSPKALPESCASLLSDQVFRSPRLDLFLRRAHAEPSAASPSPRVPSLQEPRQDGQ